MLRKTIYVLLFIFVCLRCTAPEYRVTTVVVHSINPYEKLYKATRMVESSNGLFVLNEKEQAYGDLQIRWGKLQDYNTETGNSYTLIDCYDPEISRKIFMHFAGKYPHTDYETIAKRWNGSGTKTIQYWNKIQKWL